MSQVSKGTKVSSNDKTVCRNRTSLLLGAFVLMLGACTTSGMGGGELSRSGKPDESVLYSWKSTDGGITGTMVATLPNATYQGRFFQITQQTMSDSMAPM